MNAEQYENFIKILQDHYDPNPSLIAQHFKFNSFIQGPYETIAKYVAALRALTEHCFYGDILDDMLRDRLVCGMQQDSIQLQQDSIQLQQDSIRWCLLAEKDLT